MQWLILALLVLVVLAAWVTWTAMRLERLDARCEAAWLSLDAQLVRRGAALLESTHSSVHTAEAHAIVQRAMDAERANRAAAENDVSALVSRLPASAIHEPLANACTRVKVARTFYNDGVRASAALHAKRIPRVLHLGSTRPGHEFFDIDDEPGAAIA